MAGVAQAATQAAAAAAAQAQQQQPAMADAVNRAVATQIGAPPRQCRQPWPADGRQREAAVARALEGSAEAQPSWSPPSSRRSCASASMLGATECNGCGTRPSPPVHRRQRPPASGERASGLAGVGHGVGFVHEHFAGVLNLGFEREQRMFEQLHTAFSGGLKEFKSELSAPIMEAMQQSVAKATAAHEKLVARMVNDATAKVAGGAPPAKEGSRKSLSSQSAGGPPPPPPQASGSGRSVFDGPALRPRPPRPHRSPLPLAMAQPT